VGGEEVLEAVAAPRWSAASLPSTFASTMRARPPRAADGHGDGSGVGLAGLVLVGDHDDVGVREVLGVLVAPLAGATG
jgi:hypothetical protein